MRVINIAKEQIKKDHCQGDILEKYAFFDEYFNLFDLNDRKEFEKNMNRTVKKIKNNNFKRSLKILENKVEEKEAIILRKTNIDFDVDLIIFIGDGSVDGHGVLINNKPYVFFDLYAFIETSYTLEAFLIHEIIHPIHYYFNEDFYPKYFETTEEKYLKKLVVEGIATYFTPFLSDVSFETSYWLGTVNQKEVKDWVKNCKKLKGNIGQKIFETIEKGEFNLDLYLKLYCVSDSYDLKNSRIGYYYGTEIIKNLSKQKTFKELLETDYKEFKKEISRYFK